MFLRRFNHLIHSSNSCFGHFRLSPYSYRAFSIFFPNQFLYNVFIHRVASKRKSQEEWSCKSTRNSFIHSSQEALIQPQPIFLRACHSPWLNVSQKSLVRFRGALAAYFLISSLVILHYELEISKNGWLVVYNLSNIVYGLQTLYAWVAFVSIGPWFPVLLASVSVLNTQC